MTATIEELVRIARAHAAAEAADDFETTMATLEADPVYELLPMGVALRGRAAAEAYDEYFCSTVEAMVTGYELRNEWVNDRGLAQEYLIEFRGDSGSGAPPRHGGPDLRGRRALRRADLRQRPAAGAAARPHPRARHAAGLKQPLRSGSLPPEDESGGSRADGARPRGPVRCPTRWPTRTKAA
jgi:hypothetical protein